MLVWWEVSVFVDVVEVVGVFESVVMVVGDVFVVVGWIVVGESGLDLLF